MPAAPRQFRPGRAATAVAAGALVALVALGVWQLQRREWKRELIAGIEAQLQRPPLELVEAPREAGALDWRRVRLRAELLHERSFALGAGAEGGRLGARLVTPARLGDGTLLLVDRGFVEEAELPPHLPPHKQPPGPVAIEGVARSLAALQPSWFTPDDEPQRRRFWRLDPDELERFLGEAPLAVLVVAERAEPESVLGRVKPVKVELRDPHLGYALTWFGLAAALTAIYVHFGFARGRAASEAS